MPNYLNRFSVIRSARTSFLTVFLVTLMGLGAAQAQQVQNMPMTPGVATPHRYAQRRDRRIDRLQHRREHLTGRIHHLLARHARLLEHHRERRAQRVAEHIWHLRALRARVEERIEKQR